MTDRYLIVGLGNPGREYEKTRHNIGFRAVDAIAHAHGLVFGRKQSRAALAEGTLADRKVLLVKPQTYMNLSGESVRPLMDFYKIPLEHLLVISDDMDIPLGTLRIRQKGGSGGQKGLKSISEHLATQDFARMRIGIGRPPGRMEPSAYVLRDFDSSEQILLIETLDRVVKAIDTWLRFDLAIAMTRHNGTAEESARNASLPASTPSTPAIGPAPAKRAKPPIAEKTADDMNAKDSVKAAQAENPGETQSPSEPAPATANADVGAGADVMPSISPMGPVPDSANE